MSASATRGGHNNGLPQLGQATIEQSCSTIDNDVVYVCVLQLWTSTCWLSIFSSLYSVITARWLMQAYSTKIRRILRQRQQRQLPTRSLRERRRCMLVARRGPSSWLQLSALASSLPCTLLLEHSSFKFLNRRTRRKNVFRQVSPIFYLLAIWKAALFIRCKYSPNIRPFFLTRNFRKPISY